MSARPGTRSLVPVVSATRAFPRDLRLMSAGGSLLAPAEYGNGLYNSVASIHPIPRFRDLALDLDREASRTAVAWSSPALV